MIQTVKPVPISLKSDRAAIENMKNCYICKKEITDSNYMNLFRLGNDGIIIPQGMKEKDVICGDCFKKERDSQYGSSRMYVSPNVKGLTIHNKALSPEEIKQMYEEAKRTGPPTGNDNTPHFVDHSHEKDGYLIIDGKKVKKQDLEKSR